MTKDIFINEEGLEAYELPCGCEGVKVPLIGWQNILCEEHEEELQSLLDEPTYHKRTKMRSYREI